MKRELALKSTDKKLNTESGILTDPKSPLQSSVVSPKLESTQELKFCISVPLQELLFLTSPILLVQKVSSTPLNSLTESVEI